MMLAHYVLNVPIELSGEKINVLILENPSLMADMVRDMLSQSAGEDGKFILSKNGETISMQNRVMVIIDPFSIHVNERSILNRLYSKVCRNVLDEDSYMDANRILSDLEGGLNRLIVNEPIPLESDQVNMNDLLKVSNLRFTVPDSFLEKVCDYLDILSEYSMVELFIFINLKSYMCNENISELYKHAIYRKHNLLLIENKESEYFDNEVVRIIDKDLCEIPISGIMDKYSDLI